MYVAALLTSTLLALAGARLYERCELARDLIKLGVRKDHIATWVCIAYHESRFDTAARNPSSGDHGLLQISEVYWCGAGKACGLPCSALRDDDISDDVECALSIYEEHTRLQGNGFLAWVVYPHYCKHNAKKYLANCDLSSNYKVGQRARTFIYDTYPNINVTSSIPVPSVSYPRSDNSVPVFLSIVSLLRGKFEQDFERDYNKRPKVNWSHFKIDNVDELTVPDFNQSPDYEFLAPLTTQTSTTSTTTIHPEIQYKPVKPWRTIETNQFRRRMMSSPRNVVQTETNRSKPLNETLVVHTSPQTTTKLVSSTNLITYSNISSPPESQVFQKEQEKLNNACCLNMSQSTTEIITTQMPASVLSRTTQKSSSYSEQSYSKELPQKTRNNITERIQSFWEKYSHLTTQTPNFQHNSYSKPEETLTLKPAVAWQPTTQRSTTKTMTLATHSFLSGNKVNAGENTVFNSHRIVSAPNEGEILFTTPYSIKLTTEKSKYSTRRTTKTWTTQQPQYTQTYTPSISENGEYTTEKPPTRGRGKFRTEDHQNVAKSNITSYDTTPRNWQSSTESYFNRRASTSETPKRTRTHIMNSTLQKLDVNDKLISQSIPEVKLMERQEKTSTITTSASPPTTKTTISIFDLYLNPTKRPQIPNYKYLFSNNNPSNLKIFSGGTTSSPV